MGLFSSLCCLVQMWLPLFVLNVCIIPFPGLLITASWDCIGTGFHMHGVYFSVIHFDNFNLTVLQASFLSCCIVWAGTCDPPPPGESCWYYTCALPCLGTWWHCIPMQTSLTFTIGFYRLFTFKLLTHPLALCLQPFTLSGVYCGCWWLLCLFFFCLFSVCFSVPKALCDTWTDFTIPPWILKQHLSLSSLECSGGSRCLHVRNLFITVYWHGHFFLVLRGRSLSST